MARQRKRHVQTDLFRRTRKRKRGVKLGRRPKGARSSERHKRRETFKSTEPTHVTIRIIDAARRAAANAVLAKAHTHTKALPIGSLRKRDMFLALREATIVVAPREDFHIVQMSIQGTHVHLLVEATSRLALARGMQAFQVSAAKQINRALGQRTGTKCRGSVFADRYHARILRSPKQVRNCIAYVLNNWRHHGEHRKRVFRGMDIDPYSTGVTFGGWKQLDGLAWAPLPPATYRGLVVWLPKSFLLSTLWRAHGLIDCDEVPGGHPGDE